jgi:hypothetical protein
LIPTVYGPAAAASDRAPLRPLGEILLGLDHERCVVARPSRSRTLPAIEKIG